MSRPVGLKVGYYDPFSIFQDGLRSEFEKKSKLNNLHWKLHPADSIKTIKNVQLEYVEEIPNKNEVDSYLKFMFITCLNVDEYRSKVRPLVKQWLNNIKSMKPNCIYYIILYENTDLVSKADKFLKTNLLAKLKTDFADDEMTIENIFKVKSSYSSQDDKTEYWSTLINSIKLGIVDSINIRLSYYQSMNGDIIDQTRAAKIFRDIGQDDDALKSYDLLFHLVGSINLSDGFDKASVDDYPLLNNLDHFELSRESNKFQQLSYFYYQQVRMLLKPEESEVGVVKHLIEWMRLIYSYVNAFNESYKRNEMAITLIDEFLSTEQLDNILKNSKRNITELFEKLGDLKFLKRSELIKLAYSKGYKLKGTMSEITMTEIQPQYTITNKSILEILESEDSFQKAVIQQTEDIITCYSSSQFKPKTIDTLSTELALIYFYNLDDFEISLEILNDSFDYFKNSNWRYISLNILKIYIANLEKLDGTYDEIVPVLLNSYLELLAKDEFFELDKFNKILASLKNHITIENDDIFDVKVNPYLLCDDVDTYKIKLEMTSKIEVPVEDMSLRLINDYNEVIEFRLHDIHLTKSNSFELLSTDIMYGDFTLDKLILQIGKLKLTKSLNGTVNTYPIPKFMTGGVLKYNTTITPIVPPIRDLHQDEIMIVVKIGSNDVSNCQVIFIKTDIDRLVPNSTYTLKRGDDAVEFQCFNEVNRLVFKIDEHLNAGDELRLSIPYFFPPDVSNKKSHVKLGLLFNDAKFSQSTSDDLETQLQIAVSVQDIFKSSNLFSNFSVNSAIINKPLRIQSVDLTSENSEVKTWEQPKNIIAFNDQGSTFFYKIERLNDASLNLLIDYNDIQDEIIVILKKWYLDILSKENEELVVYFSIVENVLGKLKYKLNFYSLTNIIKITNFDLSNFTEDFKKININHAKQLMRSLLNFTKLDLKVDSVTRDHALRSIKKQLSINVSLPVINTINIVEFDFSKKLQYLVCEPLSTKLKLNVRIFQMEKKEAKKVRFSNEPEIPKIITLRLDLVDIENNWLISGLKNFHMELNLEEANMAKDGKTFEFDLVLIPLKVGKLELPGIDVKNMSKFKIQMELDYKNSSESLLIVSELNKITYSF
ncbi:hypothetical protein CANARDRAFT_28708 [[Candida] arabinofermentans NRRL YB-2248]|uniref:Trafficking protein particle complex subunit 11 domain-containing protein n=1 Tax=[Candida] arabinofermentans NRRL YB-2248 TaxID=983967 RepID=A0A1E4SZN7_9ASCO|nr:hypothetical protein CANARDRAFT_28708 [[Candida] arabinofermentans NRRL YB-2248]